jgi:hypothetical protein
VRTGALPSCETRPASRSAGPSLFGDPATQNDRDVVRSAVLVGAVDEPRRR